MEDIYSELDNYEDVLALQELRIENKELKVKLEEHAAAMEKLQRDYDTLDKEFKKLEQNYSSLLKTARSEIERKTQRIMQLNTEKDMMVLDALKKNQNIRRNFNQGVRNTSKVNTAKPNKGESNKRGKEDDGKLKKTDVKNERHEANVLQAMVPDLGTCNRNKFESTDRKIELSRNRKSDVKESIAQQKTDLNEPPKTLASSIKDRRKSVPAVSRPIDTFSSDEENERNYHTKDRKTDYTRDKFERRNSTKTSETSSVDERGYNYQEISSRDTYKGRSSRHYDSSSYKPRDKYEVSSKYRKNYSPERGLKRQHREYQDDYHRQERERYQVRSLESPPLEPYSRYQRRNPEHRSDYDQTSHNHDKYKRNYEEKYANKYRLSTDYDEPHAKRPRADSYGKPDKHIKDDRKHYHEKESLASLTTPEFSPHEHDMLRFSCQSPDSVHTDSAAAANPIKEIMATAATPLEDPRETSKRYVIKKENGKDILSTVVGRNVNITPVSKASWGLTAVPRPAALERRPSQCSDKLVEDIYKDIDDPVASLNMSMESGELYETERNFEIQNTPKDHHDSQNVITNIQASESVTKQTNIEKVSEHSIAKYRIPKIGQSTKNTQSKIDVPIIDLSEKSHHKSKVQNKKGATEDSVPKEIPRKQNKDRDASLKESKSEDQNQSTLSKMAIVANDLELSDDTSDNVDTNRRAVPEPIQKDSKTQLNVKEIMKDSVKNIQDNTTSRSSLETKTEKTVDTPKNKKVTEEEKIKESDSAKKQKLKKKKSKIKDVSKDMAEGTTDATISENKAKSRKEKEDKPKETKEKFSELFGDSSSLMTPEDLGIPSYLPISEDAQDAVDMKINQIIDASPFTDNKDIPSDIQMKNNIENTNLETTHGKGPKDLQKSNTETVEDKAVLKDKKKNTFKKSAEIIEPYKPPSPIIYKNLNPGTDSNDAAVVKTVIISTGIQPDIIFENKTEGTVTKYVTDVTDLVTNDNDKQNATDTNPIPAIAECKRLDIVKALATSTPHKDFTVAKSTEVDAETNGSVVCDSEVNKTGETNANVEQVGNQTDSNTLDSQDAPDVRIFVKRRRKVVKRPPMT